MFVLKVSGRGFDSEEHIIIDLFGMMASMPSTQNLFQVVRLYHGVVITTDNRDLYHKLRNYYLTSNAAKGRVDFVDGQQTERSKRIDASEPIEVEPHETQPVEW
jgi:hypothetical protein